MNTTMNTVNQIFDWNRFTATLRKEVVENWRPILFTLLGTYGLLTIIMIIALVVILMNYLADVLCQVIDPRARLN